MAQDTLPERSPVPAWLRSAAGPWGPRLLGLWGTGEDTQIEIDAGADGPLFLVIHPPGTPGLPFSCASFGLSYRNPKGRARPAALDELSRRFGEAIAAVPGAAERLLSTPSSLPGPALGGAEPSRAVDANLTAAISRAAEGDLTGALAAWRAAGEGSGSPWIAKRARRLFSLIEGRERIGEPSAPPPPAEPPSPAWERAWAGDLAAARRLAEERPEDPETPGLLGVLDVLERRPARALPFLERALEQGGGEHLVLHRARALLHLGRKEEAHAAITTLGHDSFGRRVLAALCAAKDVAPPDAAPDFWRRVATSEYHFNALFSNELPVLFGKKAVKRALASPEARVAFLDGLLDRMAGNLGEPPTFAEVAPGGGRRFVRLALPPTPRAEAAEALVALLRSGVAGAEEAFAAILARRPRSVQARVYRGELYLWLGRYDDALWEFAASRLVEPARWADVGMVAALTFTGRLGLARLAAVYAERHFPPAEGSTLPVYRGVLRRRLGDFEGAARELEAAVLVKPTRVGARMELCLALRAAGRSAQAAEHAAVVRRDAAPILVDAAEARGIDWRADPSLLVEDLVLDEALSAMRGNRSSGIVTWIDRAGALRTLVPHEHVRAAARKLLSELGLGT